MNTHAHRLVYNPHRNSPMAVAESARSCGKGRQVAQGCRSKHRAHHPAPVNQTRIAAGGNLTLGTVTIAEKNHTGGKGYSNHSGSRTEVGTRIESDGDMNMWGQTRFNGL